MSLKSAELTAQLMHTIILIQNIKHSYFMVSRKYTNFATFLFSRGTRKNVPLVRLRQFWEARPSYLESKTFHMYKLAQHGQATLLTSNNALKKQDIFYRGNLCCLLNRFLWPYNIELKNI